MDEPKKSNISKINKNTNFDVNLKEMNELCNI